MVFLLFRIMKLWYSFCEHPPPSPRAGFVGLSIKMSCPSPGQEANTELRMFLEFKSTGKSHEDSNGVNVTHPPGPGLCFSSRCLDPCSFVLFEV